MIKDMKEELEDLRTTKITLLEEKNSLQKKLSQEEAKYEKRMVIYGGLKEKYAELETENEDQQESITVSKPLLPHIHKINIK